MSKIITAIDSKVNELFAKTTVTQKFTNSTDNPLELKIYVYKKEGLIFSEFFCQIGYSIKVKSKVIKKEKAEQKYTDSIASGNAAIFVSDDPDNENSSRSMFRFPGFYFMNSNFTFFFTIFFYFIYSFICINLCFIFMLHWNGLNNNIFCEIFNIF